MVLKPYRPPRDGQASSRVVYGAYWGARPDSPIDIAECARRTAAVLQGLGGPYAGRWGFVTNKGWTPMPTSGDDWIKLVLRGYETGLDGEPYLPAGSRLLLLTEPSGTSDVTAKLSITAGCVDAERSLSAVNHVLVSAGSVAATDYSPVRAAATAVAARQVVRDLVLLWAPDFTTATTEAAIDEQWEQDRGPVPPLGAINWLADAVWPLPSQLPGAVVEPFVDGHLVTVNTVHQPSFETDQIVDLARYLIDHGFLAPAPVRQERPPRAPQAQRLGDSW